MLGSDIIQMLDKNLNMNIDRNTYKEYVSNDKMYDDQFEYMKLFFKNKIRCGQLDDADKAWFQYKMRERFVWSNNHWDDNLYFITKPLLKSISF